MIKVISGAQTGADVAGLWAAKLFDIETGGWAPKGFITLDGPHPEMAKTFGIKEHSQAGYRDRTIANLLESDVTIICSEKMSPGTKLTINQCKKADVTHFIFALDPLDMDGSLNPGAPVNTFNFGLVVKKIKSGINVHKLLNLQTPFIINVAGNSTKNSARVFEFTFRLCHKLFTELGYTSKAYPSDWKLYKDRWEL